jgi:tetraacyldisaccharide 4'-kinase
MLARALPGVAVVVGASRYADGQVAEGQLGATVHVLDDGFQHLQMARDLDLLVVSEDDLADIPLPAGRLREPLTAAAAADAVLVTAGYATAVDRIARGLGVTTAFQVTRALGAPRTVASPSESVVVPPEARVFVVAGIARPERFFSDIESAGWRVVGTMPFRDHYRYRQSDVSRMAKAARSAAAAIVLTTEKDAVRLERCDLSGLPIAAVPLIVGVEPADRFRTWLLESLARVR